MLARVGFRWIEKYAMKIGAFMGGLSEIRKSPSREVFRICAVDIAYQDSLEEL